MYDYSTTDSSTLSVYQKDILNDKPINANRLIVLAFRAQQMSNVLHMYTFDQACQMPNVLDELTWDEDDKNRSVEPWTDQEAVEYICQNEYLDHYLLHSLAAYRRFANKDELELLEKIRFALEAHMGATYQQCYARLFETTGVQESENPYSLPTYRK